MTDSNNQSPISKFLNGLYNFVKKYVFHSEVEWSKNNEQHSGKIDDYIGDKKQEQTEDRKDNSDK